MQDRLNSLIEKHCETIKSGVAQLGVQLKDIASGTASDPVTLIQEAEALAHQLKGSGGTAGFLELSRAATKLDDHLKTLCQCDAEAVRTRIDEAVSLYQELQHIAVAIEPKSSTLYHAA